MLTYGYIKCLRVCMLKYEEAVTQTCSVKKGVLRNFVKFTGKHLCQSLYFNKVNRDSAQVFSCEFYEIFKTTFSYRTPPVAPSEYEEVQKYLRFSFYCLSSSCMPVAILITL